MATSRFVQITGKEINEIKINSILKHTKDPTKFGVKLRLRLGEYSPIITSPWANNC